MMVFRAARQHSPRLRERLGDRNVQTEKDGSWRQTDTKTLVHFSLSFLRTADTAYRSQHKKI